MNLTDRDTVIEAMNAEYVERFVGMGMQEKKRRDGMEVGNPSLF